MGRLRGLALTAHPPPPAEGVEAARHTKTGFPSQARPTTGTFPAKGGANARVASVEMKKTVASPVIAVGPRDAPTRLFGVIKMAITRGPARAMAEIRPLLASPAAIGRAAGKTRVASRQTGSVRTAAAMDVHPVVALAAVSRVASRTVCTLTLSVRARAAAPGPATVLGVVEKERSPVVGAAVAGVQATGGAVARRKPVRVRTRGRLADAAAGSRSISGTVAPAALAKTRSTPQPP